MTGSVPVMRWKMTTMVIALLAAACTSTPADSDSSATEIIVDEQTTSTDATTVSLPPQIADLDVQSVQVGDRVMLLAIADNPGLRRQA